MTEINLPVLSLGLVMQHSLGPKKFGRKHHLEEYFMVASYGLGKIYKDGEIIIHQGEVGDSTYVIQEGFVEIIHETDQGQVIIARRGKGEFFGEMAIFEDQVRSASVRARGNVRVLTVDKKNLLRRFQEDPSLAFNLVQTLSFRIRELTNEISNLRQGQMNNYL